MASPTAIASSKPQYSKHKREREKWTVCLRAQSGKQKKKQSSLTSICININVENVLKSKGNVIVSGLSGARGLIDHENHRFG